MVADPYATGWNGWPRRKTEERTLWCATCNVVIGGQVASANNTGHRYAQQMANEGWKEHVAERAANPT